MQTKQETVSV